jgi:hypothetical protein
MIVEINDRMARNALAPPLGYHCPYQLERWLTVVIPPHPRLDGGIEQAEEASCRRFAMAAGLVFCTIPARDSLEVRKSTAQNHDIIFSGGDGTRQVDYERHDFG